MEPVRFSHIDSLLIQAGFVKPEDIEKASKIAENLNLKSKLPVCVLLTKDFTLDEKDLVKILNQNSIYDKSIEIIINKGYINRDEIKPYITKYSNPARLITALENDKIIDKEKKNMIFNEILGTDEAGKAAIKLELTDEKALEMAFRTKKYKKSVCEVLYENHLVTLSELNHIFRSLDSSLKLGEILLALGLIDRKKLENTLREQAVKKITLGSIFVNNNDISIVQLYFALSIQYNTPFRPLSNFIYSEQQAIELKNIIKREFAKKNLIIPVVLSGNNLTLGVFNPFQTANLNDIMAEFGYLSIKCILITHNKFEQLYAFLYEEVLNVTNDLVKKHQDKIKPDQKTVISEPDSEYRLINDLFERFINLSKDKTGDKESKRKIFHDFINESYENIKREYKCIHVAFWFDISGDNVEIMASPVLSQ